jgi:hypothetical protein
MTAGFYHLEGISVNDVDGDGFHSVRSSLRAKNANPPTSLRKDRIQKSEYRSQEEIPPVLSFGKLPSRASGSLTGQVLFLWMELNKVEYTN